MGIRFDSVTVRYGDHTILANGQLTSYVSAWQAATGS
jgi:hypothetical protein